jgi:hypothetical protein
MVTRDEMFQMLGSGTGVKVDPRTGEDLDNDPNNRATKTYTGQVFSLFDPTTWTFNKLDIARPLSNCCRWAGHIDYRQVGAHCIEVALWLRKEGAPPLTQLLGLLHDASEAYLLDIPRPWKQEVWIDGRSYLERESELEHAIFTWAGVLPAFEKDWGWIKEADLANFLVERASRGANATKLPFLHPDTCLSDYLAWWHVLEQEAGIEPR